MVSSAVVADGRKVLKVDQVTHWDLPPCCTHPPIVATETSQKGTTRITPVRHRLFFFLKKKKGLSRARKRHLRFSGSPYDMFVHPKGRRSQ